MTTLIPLLRYCCGYFVTLLLTTVSLQSLGQDSCGCPSIYECGPCTDGLTTLTLRYNGTATTTVNIAVDDQQGTVFNDAVDPGDTITINGSPPNGKFAGNKLSIWEDGVLKLTINVSCDRPVYLGSMIGNFSVIDGRSKSGGPLCCDPATVERVPPVIDGCPAGIEQSVSKGSCSAVIHWVEPTASDNCEVLSFTSSHQPGETFPAGTTEVVYTAVDKFGTSATCAFDIVVREDIPPTFENCPANIVVAADENCMAQVSWSPPTAQDNCTITSLTSSGRPGDQYPLGVTEITYTAADASGNTATCSFTVTVRDESPPVFAGCPQDVLVTAGAAGQAPAYWSPPAVPDDCGEIVILSSHQPGENFPVGSTAVTYTATDDKGNSATCGFEVHVAYAEVDFDFTKIITPDGDGINDALLLKNIEKYSDNQVTVVDRWGSVIFQASGYDNQRVVWKGQNAAGTAVPTGTYFYAITVRVGGDTVQQKGFIELLRSR